MGAVGAMGVTVIAAGHERDAFIYATAADG